MKKQLCVHLIKMGQMTQALVATAALPKTSVDSSIGPRYPLDRRLVTESICEDDSVCEEFGQQQQKFINNNSIKSMPLHRQVGRLRTLMRDQGTITDNISQTTIIDIDWDNSEVSL
jgi:hypothetical protein